MLLKNANILSENNKILKNIDLHVSKDTIDYIGENYYGTDCEVFDCTDMLVLPGFCNTHCHVSMTLLRGLGGNLPLNLWLNNFIFPIESRLTPEHVYYGALLGIAEMIRGGVTSFNDMYYFSDRVCAAVLESGINANIALDGFAFDEKLGNKFSVPDTALYDFHKEFNNKNNGQLKIDMCIHAEYTTTSKKAEALANIAKSAGSNIQLHLSETKKENVNCIALHKKTPTEFFNELGVFDSPTTAAHCVYLTDSDLKILHDKNVSVAHCPISNLKLGSGIADILRIKNAGINVTLGTDGAASNDNLDVLSDMKTAILLQKGIHEDASALSAGEILEISTLNGAISQGRKNTGKIAVGKKADLFVMDFNKPNLQPCNSMLDSAVYASLTENIVLTMANGKVLYKNGVFTTIDIDRVLNKVKEIKKSLNLSD